MRKDDKDRSTREERENRLLAGAAATSGEPDAIAFQHSILCQVVLPYRNPGDDVRRWARRNGRVLMEVSAGRAYDDSLGEFIDVGLPYGTKPRLLLCHLNAEALRQNSPVIQVERTLTAFVKAMGLHSMGRNIVTIKDQLARLAAASIMFGFGHEGQSITIRRDIISSFDMWMPRQDGRQVLLPSTVRMSGDYFSSLTKHAVPLHDAALAALSGSAMALDVYCWLAQRLHRIEWGAPAFVPWSALHSQFGFHYDQMYHFRAVFLKTLRDVHSQYRAADIDIDRRGLTLRHSPPPVKGRTGIVNKLP